MQETGPATPRPEDSHSKEPVDYAKKYWWAGVIAMPLLLFVLARVWPEHKAGPATGASITNFVTVQNEILAFTKQPLSDPALKAIIEQALDLTAKGDYRASIPLYQKAVSAAPVPSLYNNLGVAYANTGNSQEARVALREALKTSPDYKEAKRNLAAMETADRAETYLSDRFDGRLLPGHWTVMNADPKKWTMQPDKKSLLIVAQTGRLSDSKNLKNWVVLNKDLPSGDFEATVEASLQIQQIGNYVLAGLYADDRNYFALTFSGDPYGLNIARTAHFEHMSEGNSNRLDGAQRYGVQDKPERIFFKLERSGNQYSGSVAFADATKDGELQWLKIGTLPHIGFNGKLVLAGANFQDAPSVAAEFYSVAIRKL